MTGSPGSCGSCGSAGNGGSGSAAGGGGGATSCCDGVGVGAGVGLGVGAGDFGFPGRGCGREGRLVRLEPEVVVGRAWRTASPGARVAATTEGPRLLRSWRSARAASMTASPCDSVTGEAAPAPEVPPPVLTQSTLAARAAIARTNGAATRISPYRLRPPRARTFDGVGIYTGNVRADDWCNRSSGGTLTRGNSDLAKYFLFEPAQS